MSSSTAFSVIFSLLLLNAIAVLISSAATIGHGKNTNALDVDDALEKEFDNMLRMIFDRVKMLKDCKDAVQVQKIMSELEATEDTRTRLNAYLYKRMDTNKVGV
jgi:hypothetical protein